MHIEFLVEDSSGAALLRCLIPKLIGEQHCPHTWNLHSYKGVGKLPAGMKAGTDASKRILLSRLPAQLRGYSKTSGIDAVVVVLDSDRRDCKALLQELHQVRDSCGPSPTKILFRLAIEEIEAWYLGDRAALLQAYPKARVDVLGRYQQDSICDTWERLADVVYPGGAKALQTPGAPLPGQVKHEWAERIGPLLDVDDPSRNRSPSFQKLCAGLRSLVSSATSSQP